MASFATLETPGGFPVPALPIETSRWEQHPSDCLENDDDYRVRDTIRKKHLTGTAYHKGVVKLWRNGLPKQEDEGVFWLFIPLRKIWRNRLKKKKDEYDLRYTMDECRSMQKEWEYRVGTPAAICKTGLVLSRDNICQKLRSSIMKDLQTLRKQEESAMATIAIHPRYKTIKHLVHPSLYAYEKGVTHVLPNVGAEALSSPAWDSFLGRKGVVNNDRCIQANKANSFQYEDESSKIQWLPSEFFVSSSSNDNETRTTTKTKCYINSYINNLHPIKYKGLYKKIGELFVEVLPLMEEVLSEVNKTKKIRRHLLRHIDSLITHKKDWEYRMGKPPPIPTFCPPTCTAEKTDVCLIDCPLQVIVKLIAVELKPIREADIKSLTREQLNEYFMDPDDCFRSFHWNVEGTQEERIVATACCYLDSENVKEEGLYFRDGSVGSSGCNLGRVETFPGRILVWPNYMHHRTKGVTLIDEGKRGHRTLCCFHLVDPTLRIRSTATVPPQQESWSNELVDLALSSLADDGLVRSSICDHMVKDGSTINDKQALERRLRLSEERSARCKLVFNNFYTPAY